MWSRAAHRSAGLLVDRRAEPTRNTEQGRRGVVLRGTPMEAGKTNTHTLIWRLPARRNEWAFHSEIVVRRNIHPIIFYQYFVPIRT
jgi:hypothetical protein